ncbi:MAG: hypothetical protein GY869_29990, partial [Planctomycetes bacterium]|nr:hypothetical protein [Planctomycetota bacterium]
MAKIGLVLLVFLVVLPVLTVFLAVQTGFLRDYINSNLNAVIPTGIPLRIIIDDISGPYYKGVSAKDIIVINTGSSPDTVLAAEHVQLTYRITDLLAGRL